MDTPPPADALEEMPAAAPVTRKGEYARHGDFHRHLNPNWNYYPIYLNKLEVIDDVLRRHHAERGAILDAGCGEGVLVERYRQEGWNILGVDKNYASEYVREGSLTDLPVPSASIDVALCLDVLEHLLYPDQGVAMTELCRTLKPGGLLVLSIPNLAHFTARLKLLFRGRLLRTAALSHHPGDRPALEYQQMLDHYGFEILERHGIFPTVPPIYRWVMRHPARSAGLLRWLRRVPLPTYWCFQVIFVCRYVRPA